jgi:CHASE3 domain sensor protein|tara:strand:+ start:51503 stop:52165 length:663 start_codon:yes stop_codon:yes gene_type:complete
MKVKVRKKLLLLSIIITFFMMVNLTLLTVLQNQNKALQNVILDFRNVSRDLYELHRSMLNMVNADQAFATTEQIPFLQQFIKSSDEFKANIYSLKQSLISLPLAYKMLEEVESIFLSWLNTSYPNIKRYQNTTSQAEASRLSQSLDESIRTEAIQHITGLVAQVKNLWYQHVVTVVNDVNAKARFIQIRSIAMAIGTVLFLILFSFWITRGLVSRPPEIS